MAGLKFTAQTAEVASGVAKKTVLQITAPANQRVLVKEWSVSFDGESNTDAPVLVQILRQSDNGSGGDALTPVKKDSGDDEAIQTTALKDIDGSTQPTDTAEVMGENVHPQGGHTWQAPFGDEIIVKGGESLGIAVTAGATVNVKARFSCEE